MATKLFCDACGKEIQIKREDTDRAGTYLSPSNTVCINFDRMPSRYARYAAYLYKMTCNECVLVIERVLDKTFADLANAEVDDVPTYKPVEHTPSKPKRRWWQA